MCRRFFCSRKRNGKSGSAVNGDGLLLRPGAHFRLNPISKTLTGVPTSGVSLYDR
jgi:hypothetical protein